MKTIQFFTLAIVTATLFTANSNAQHPSQYKIENLSNVSDLVASLGDKDVSKDFSELMARSNRIVKIEKKIDLLITDVIRIIYVVDAKFCRPIVVPQPCLGGGRLEITSMTGTFLPPGQASTTHYSSKLSLFR